MSDASTTLQKVAAEFVGIFVLVFFGCGTAVMSGGDYVATGLAFGLAVLVMAYAVGRITGGHFNPAVTIGAVLGGRLPWSQVGVYIGAQLVGAIAAGLSLFILLQGFEGFDAEGNMGQNAFGDASANGYAWWAAFLLETLMTLIFVWVILFVTDTRNEHPAHGSAGHRPGADDDPLRIHRGHRHLGEPGPLDRRRPLRRTRRNRPALVVHHRADPGRRAGGPELPAPVRARRPTRCGLRPVVPPGSRRRSRVRRPRPVPAGVEPGRRPASAAATAVAVRPVPTGVEPGPAAPPAAPHRSRRRPLRRRHRLRRPNPRPSPSRHRPPSPRQVRRRSRPGPRTTAPTRPRSAHPASNQR